MGRPRALDHVKRGEICALISAGCSVDAAASYVGCHTITIRREALRNPEFADQFRQAEVRCQLVPLQSVREAARTNWRAAAWLLERADPDKFARPTPRLMSFSEFEHIVATFMKAANETIHDQGTRAQFLERLLSIWKNVETDVDRPQRNALCEDISTVTNEDETTKEEHDVAANP